MKIAQLFGTTPAADRPTIPAAEAALAAHDQKLALYGERIAGIQDQIATVERAKVAAQHIADAPSRIQQTLAAEEARIAVAELDGEPIDDTSASRLRADLAAALSAAEAAHSRARIEAAKIDHLSQQVQEVNAHIRALIDQRPRLVLDVIREKLAARAVGFEAIRLRLIAEHTEVFALATAHDRLSEALRLGNFKGGGRVQDLRLPIPEGHAEHLDLDKLYRDVDGRASTLLRDLKVMA